MVWGGEVLTGEGVRSSGAGGSGTSWSALNVGSIAAITLLLEAGALPVSSSMGDTTPWGLRKRKEICVSN